MSLAMLIVILIILLWPLLMALAKRRQNGNA